MTAPIETPLPNLGLKSGQWIPPCWEEGKIEIDSGLLTPLV